MSVKTIVLHGWLGKKYGAKYTMDISSPAEAIRALCSQVKGFHQELAKDKDGFRIRANNDPYTKETLSYPFGSQEILHIVPAICGSKDGIGQLLLGVVLLGAAFISMGTSFAGIELLGGVTVGQALTTIGVSMFLGGLSQLLFAPPKASKPSERPENKPSYSFNGPVNTIQQGNGVPICYGELIVGSQVVSAGFYAENIAV